MVLVAQNNPSKSQICGGMIAIGMIIVSFLVSYFLIFHVGKVDVSKYIAHHEVPEAADVSIESTLEYKPTREEEALVRNLSSNTLYKEELELFSDAEQKELKEHIQSYLNFNNMPLFRAESFLKVHRDILNRSPERIAGYFIDDVTIKELSLSDLKYIPFTQKKQDLHEGSEEALILKNLGYTFIE